MASNLKTISELYTDVAKSISNPDNWMAFLNTAAWQYKYPFENQLLIYAQRPDAKACASYKLWNNKLHRWVKRGASGIALLREGQNGQYLNYVFDVADTGGIDGTEVKLWEYSSKYEDDVSESLQNNFGVEIENSLPEVIISASKTAVSDNKADYLSDFEYIKSDSFLEELDSQNIALKVQALAENSVAYIIMTRMGIDTSEYFKYEDFMQITDFNTPETISALGTIISDISEEALRDISKTIRAAERGEAIKNQENFAENNFAVYNNEQREEINNNLERNEENDSDKLLSGRRLSDAELSIGTNRTDRQIRDDEAKLPQETSQGTVLSDEGQRDTDEPHTGSGQDGERTDTAVGGEDSESGRSDGGDESRESNEVDGTYEQHPTFSRGSGSEFAGLQLSLFDSIPGEAEQKDIVQKAAQRTFGAAFLMPQQIIDEVLTSGSNATDSILGTCIQYSKNKSPEDNISFLKDLYAVGGKGFIIDSREVSAWWNEEGIRISYGSSTINKGHLISWEDVDKRIDELLEAQRFAPQEILDRMTDYEYKKASETFWYMHQDVDTYEYPELEDLFNKEWFEGGFPDSTARINKLMRTPEGLASFIKTVDALENLHNHNKDIMRFRLYYPANVKPILTELSLERKVFTSEYSFNNPMRFITEDEISYSLCSKDRRYNETKIRIYLYFQEHSDAKERADFLKGLHGNIGSGYLDVAHNKSKGISIKRGDISNPMYNSVNLTWLQLSKRIDTLIYEGKYLSKAEIEEDIPKYLAKQEALRIKQEKIKYVEDSMDWSETDKFMELPKRIAYYIETIGGYENGFFENNGMPEAAKATELDIAEFIKNAESRENLAKCIYKIARGTGNIYDRNCGYKFAEELSEIKTITLNRVGDFYEIYGDEAKTAANLLDLSLTSKPIDGESIPLVGLPSHAIEKYSRVFQDNLYLPILTDSAIARNISNEQEQEITPSLASDIVDFMFDNEYFEIRGFFESGETYKDAISRVSEELQNPDNVKNYIDSFKRYISEINDDTDEIQWAEGLISQLEAISPEEQAIEEVKLEAPKLEKTQKAANTVIYPEIPFSERNNFVILNDELGYGGPKEKFRKNMEAIKVLKECEFDHRFATPEEQAILSEYVGWGGLADAFDESKENWKDEFTELYTTLSPEEYESARASTLSSHFTSPVIIKAIYKALGNMGFSQGNILEPACGIGNFMGLLPENMSDSKIYGIELDSITGRIAQQLYQKNSIAIQGFEDTSLPDSFFDVAIGNVPFGDFKVSDKKYDKYNFLIHDFFFAKTLDKVRPGGVVAFITSSGTMDKTNSKVRKYIAQRADLLGAIRLPNTAFKKNAGTEVTADILFLQKRDKMTDIMPEWVNIAEYENGQYINQYFTHNPNMIMGEVKEVSGPFGQTLTCMPDETRDLSEQLNDAIQNIHAEITEYEFEDISEDEAVTIPADPEVRNFSYTISDGDIYFRENSSMRKVETTVTGENRIRGMIEIRDCVRKLIEMQTENYSDAAISNEQARLNTLYDKYTKKYGLINSRGNQMAFSDDSSYFLLCSLEILDENGELKRKADMFTKRTIRAKKEVTEVDTSDEALAVSLSEKAKIDMEFMSSLTGKSEEELYNDLKGVIFINPYYEPDNPYEPAYLTADEYLSGNVREKLRTVEKIAAEDTDYQINVDALGKVQPKDLGASEISVRLGSTWIPPEYIKGFIVELLSPSYHASKRIGVSYSNLSGAWTIVGKSEDRGIKALSTYGTDRINAYKIIEDTLNLKDVQIFDYYEDENGKKKAKLNVDETTIARQKQETIKEAFNNWIWKDPERRDTLTAMYNERFNSVRPREYDGSHLTFNGINPEIELRKHQKDAVARILYGGNTLLAHVVGAGKTWTMVAAAMESRRLGLCNKPLFVVPNHLTEQWASEFLQLYPAANIMVATKKDFEMKNRKKFCGRIATGDYDAVIIGHSQFEKVPMSKERQMQLLERQKNEIIEGIIEAKKNSAERFTVKDLERTKKSIEEKIKKLNDQSRKDDVVTFEELGVDRIFVDEAHYYKNLFVYSKMRNVSGISQTEAQKSSDLFMKTQYLDEITGGKGVIFATGTPISNSMVEMYTMQRYLQYKLLTEMGLAHFDSWASTFGETVTALELAPEGTGYRSKKRFAKFFNLPELMSMFKEVADVQTADMLKLPVPEVEYVTITLNPSEFQKQMVEELGKRAERIHNGGVDPSVDNMLKITNDGRKLALDQRLINPLLPEDENSKSVACAKETFKEWQRTAEFKGTQLVFCDFSTPKKNDEFNLYDATRDKLIELGVPEKDIAYIHNANSEIQKKELFSKLRSGEIRILLGSTQKMGAGTNVQRLLSASNDLDCPWRPADLDQRAGRIIRQGNLNDKVTIRRFVVKDTFDAYLWQTVENKQKFISQIMTSKTPVRSADDIDDAALSYAEIKALATGNPHIKEKMELDTEVAKLKLVKQSFMSQIYELEDKVIKYYPQKISEHKAHIKGLEKDIETAKNHPKKEDEFNTMTIDGMGYFEKEKAGNALIERCKKLTSEKPVTIGDYRGFSMILSFEYQKFYCTLKGDISHKVELGADVFGNIQRLDNALEKLPETLENVKIKLTDTQKDFETAKVESKREFPQEAELKEKIERLSKLDALLDMDKKDSQVLDTGEEQENEETSIHKKREYEIAR